MKRDPELMRELLLLAADGQLGTVGIERATVRHHHVLLLNDLALLSEDDGVYSITELGKRVAAVVADDDVWSHWRDSSGDLGGLLFGQLAKMIEQAQREMKTPPEGGARLRLPEWMNRWNVVTLLVLVFALGFLLAQA